MKIKKLVAIEPVNFHAEGREEVKNYCDEVIFYDTEPKDSAEIAERIGDADAIFVSYVNPIGEDILSKCPNLKYIGMCCSLYSEASSNVDIRYAREHGIVVKGVKDYGDDGVGEFVISNLIRRLHGVDGFAPFKGNEYEVSGVKVGILGMGASAQKVAKGLTAFGGNVFYYSRTRKPEIEEACGYQYLELRDLLRECDVICSCLSKNVTLLHREEFEVLGENKILFNSALSPFFDAEEMEKWLEKENTWYICDNLMGLGKEEYLERENVFCEGKCSGMTWQAEERLNKKVIENMKEYLGI